MTIDFVGNARTAFDSLLTTAMPDSYYDVIVRNLRALGNNNYDRLDRDGKKSHDEMHTEVSKRVAAACLRGIDQELPLLLTTDEPETVINRINNLRDKARKHDPACEDKIVEAEKKLNATAPDALLRAARNDYENLHICIQPLFNIERIHRRLDQANFGYERLDRAGKKTAYEVIGDIIIRGGRHLDAKHRRLLAARAEAARKGIKLDERRFFSGGQIGDTRYLGTKRALELFAREKIKARALKTVEASTEGLRPLGLNIHKRTYLGRHVLYEIAGDQVTFPVMAERGARLPRDVLRLAANCARYNP